jgi:rubredoxin
MNRYECTECGLIWQGEMLNLIDSAADREKPLSNYCPNCGVEFDT